MSNRIVEYLESADIEMVRLGAALLQNRPKHEWWVIDAVKKNCSWISERTEDEIVINRIEDIIDLWTMGRKVSMPLISMTTNPTTTIVLSDSTTGDSLSFKFSLPYDNTTGENNTATFESGYRDGTIGSQLASGIDSSESLEEDPS